MDAPITEKPFLNVQKPAKTCKNLQRDRRKHEWEDKAAEIAGKFLP
jgi:hypothetical protein